MATSGEGQHDKIYEFGAKVSFGKTADDYSSHRAGFPDAFFELLKDRRWASEGQAVLDIGTGTGTVARGLHEIGCKVVGTDPSEEMLAQARKHSSDIHFVTASAEDLPFGDASFDLVTAGQCWHWFHRANAADEASRVLRPDGRILIAHFDWLPLPGNVVSATEALILSYNPEWAAGGGTGMYPAWLNDLGTAGFTDIETASFDVAQPYSHAAWRGRIRASAGVAASLSADKVSRFDADLAAVLNRNFQDDPLIVPHRVWIATARKT